MSTDGLELLSAAEMMEADRLAVEAGVSSLTLMENAGRAVADEAARMVAPGARIAVLCGPGNNGGDGFVAARLLAHRGYRISVFSLRPIEDLKGDAAVMARRFDGQVLPLAAFLDGEGDCSLAIDALLGTGLRRDLAPDLVGLLASVLAVAAAKPMLAVDVPSGMDATSGAMAAWSQPAARTVTFFRRKLGHVLFPARARCGEVIVADIAIPDQVLGAISPRVHANRAPRIGDLVTSHGRAAIHKYTRGHALVVSGGIEMSGAARLAARAALRSGAGLVTIASPPDALAAHAAQLNAILLKAGQAPEDLRRLLADPRRNAVVVGPGLGVGDGTLDRLLVSLESPAAVVVDADAITSAAAAPDVLFRAIEKRSRDVGAGHAAAVVLTPHEGEFARLFPGARGSKLDRAREAAERSGAIVVLKGPDTVIAHPDGRAVINENAPATLATAGSGDVLAGFMAGLLAHGMPPWEAACAAVWLHGACADHFGPGLIAEDISEQLPAVLRALHAKERSA